MISENKINFDVANKNCLKLMAYGLSYEAACVTLIECKLYSKELTIRLTNNNEIKNLNRLWRKSNVPTNVLAFPNNKSINHFENYSYIGDIAISYEKIIEESTNYSISFIEHMIHLIIHGILHLAGFDHDKKDDEKKMINIEEKIMKKIGIENSILNIKYIERN